VYTTHLGTTNVEILNLAELGQSSLQGTVFDLAVYILDVCALLVGISSGSLGLRAYLLLFAAGCSLPACGFALASRW
jgi:hypothetical protein